jgi:hypothetical protein
MHPRSRQARRKARPTSPKAPAPAQPEEVLVTDSRAGLTPSDMVERKLLYLLRGASVAARHVHVANPRPRGGYAG